MTELIGVGIRFDPSGAEQGATAADAQFDRVEKRAEQLEQQLGDTGRAFDEVGAKAQQISQTPAGVPGLLNDLDIENASEQFDISTGKFTAIERNLEKLSEVARRNKADLDAGRLSAEQYAESIRGIRSAAVTVTNVDDLSQKEVGALNKVLRQTQPLSRRAVRGLTSVSRGLVAVGASSVGARGGVSTLLSSFVGLGGASAPILAVAAGITGIAVGYKFLTRQQREAREELDKFIDKQLEAAKLDVDPGAALQEKFDRIQREINQAEAKIEFLERPIEVGPGEIVSGVDRNAAAIATTRKELGDLNVALDRTREDLAGARGESSKAADDFFELADSIEFSAATMGLSQAQTAILAVKTSELNVEEKTLAISALEAADAQFQQALATKAAADEAEKAAEAFEKARKATQAEIAAFDSDRLFALDAEGRELDRDLFGGGDALDDQIKANEDAAKDLIAAIALEGVELRKTNRELVEHTLIMGGVSEEQRRTTLAILDANEAFRLEEEAATKTARAAEVAWERAVGNVADATTDFIESALGGFDSMSDAVDNVLADLQRLASALASAQIFDLIAAAIPRPAGSGGGGGTDGVGVDLTQDIPPFLSRSGPQGATPVIQQEVVFQIHAVDAEGVDQVIRRQKGTIMQVVAEGARESSGFRSALFGG